jgi:hypothetical protein
MMNGSWPQEEELGMEAPRSAEQRKSDTLARLASDVDAWDPRKEAGDYVFFRIVPDLGRPGVRSMNCLAAH